MYWECDKQNSAIHCQPQPRPADDAGNTLTSSNTSRGYTGHEHLDGLDFVHMNGRVYDPVLGRFLMSDPYIGQPQDMQNYNRYSYVSNNPLSATDPTGYLTIFGHKITRNDALSFVGWIACPLCQQHSYMVKHNKYYGQASVITAGVACGPAGAECAAGMAAVNTAILGGDVKDVLKAAAYVYASAAASTYIGDQQAAWGMLGTASAHGVAQGTLSYMQGGSFGAGFASGFVGKYAGGYGLVGSMVTGGISSKIAGGTFADGAYSAGLVHLFNDAIHESLQRESAEIGENPRSAKKYVGDGDFQYETVLDVNVADLTFAGKYLRAVSNVINNLGITVERGTRYFQYGTKYDVVDQIRLTARDQSGNITYQSHVIDYKNTGTTRIDVPPGSQPLMESNYRICMGDGLACSSR